MKVYILTNNDLERLLTEISRDPQYGTDGGSSLVQSDEKREAFNVAHQFYNYVIRRWIDSVKEPQT